MTQPPQPRFGAPPNGFIADQGGPPPAHLPAKIGFRRRVRPECELQFDGWALRPETLRTIWRDLHQQAHIAERERRFRDRDRLGDAADVLDHFLRQRMAYGEKRGPWS